MLSVEGGLFEALTSSSVPDELWAWMSESTRTAGDTTVISPENEETTYVAYYVGANDAEWILNIRNTLLSQKMSEYMDNTVGEINVEDPKKNLRYLQVRAEEEAAAAASEALNDSAEASDESGESQENSESQTEGSAAE